ncbi:MAG: metallophosphoesterase [Thermoplasmata archaeon]|nr:MAG: metallophosphoesterase [Thermoplasmata archaeon]
MKILAVSDIHNSEPGLEFILERLKKYRPDLLLICGDITTFGPKAFGLKVIEQIDVQAFGVPGNCDPPNLHDIYDKGTSINLHGKSIEHEGFRFVGWGGSNKSLNTPFENPESNILESLEPVLKKATKTDTEPVILLSHCPPHGYLDVVPSGQHVGCTSIAELVDKYRPVLTVCGHIHEAKGIVIDTERNLIIVNTGPAKLHSGAKIELGEPEKVKYEPLEYIKVELIS